MSEKLLQQILEELKGMKSQFADFKQEQERTNQRLSHIENDIPQIKQAVLETLKKVNRLEETQELLIKGQERQDKILESLALRSLEQETELREIKRIK
ncbi:hypothetical protein NSQ14_12010 [Caldifermentibacillus hisashii]|uniref:hypothetical protein n=1 Tax=Caldifermentibacillus hisashii TaxID=996558 RepID=UPI0031B70648